jgi:LacI family transcriptional regulator
MISQKEIARTLGITQAAVSRALRGDRRISPEMRQKVRDTAERMGYQLNDHVSALMSNIRTRKKLNDKGTIGLLINARSQEAWHKADFFRGFHQGLLQRGVDLGFHIEPFFLLAPNMRDSRIDQILQARGIDGIILAPPGDGKNVPELQWERYATVSASVGWAENVFNRVYCDQFQSYITAFNELQRRGYRRIGTVLSSSFVQGSRQKTRWYTGYLDCQNDLLETDRIPIHVCNRLGRSSEQGRRVLYAEFRKWFLQWRPEVILTLLGDEKQWLTSMKLRVPQDVGIACLARPPDDRLAGIDQKSELLGATALELVAAQIARNEFGLPPYPKVMMISGQWRDGSTVRNTN